MKLTAVLIFAFSFQTFAISGFSQKRINIDLKNIDIKKVFEFIETRSDYRFVYGEDVSKVSTPVSVYAKNATIDFVMEELLKSTNLSYKKLSNNLVIIVGEKLSETLAATITGRVIDEDGNGILGVSIVEKGTKNGTTTSQNGEFAITVRDNRAVLIVSYVGYNTVEVPVNSQTNIIINLTAVQDALNEVVVVGYGTQRRRDLTGSVGSVRMDEAAKTPVNSYAEALAGRVAGVVVNTKDGQPGSVSGILIRGASSVTQSNEPLYVVDGFPLEDGLANSLNLDDIETIDILKDASATAIYGARGANGVVVITTKKGRSGTVIVDLNTFYGVQKSPRQVKMMNSYEYVKFWMGVSPGLANTYFNEEHPTIESYKDEPTLNLQDHFFRTGNIQNLNISVRGGTDKTQYSISGNYLDQNGIIITSGFKRMQTRLKLDQKVNKKLNVGINANYAYSLASGVPVAQPGVATGLNSTNPSQGLLYAVWSYRPVLGNFSDVADELVDAGLPIQYNPVTEIQNMLRRAPNYNLISNAYAEYNFTKNLSLKVTGGYTRNDTESQAFYNSKTYYGADTIPGRGAMGNGVSGSIYNSQWSTWVNENTLNYKNTFVKHHRLNALLGASFQKLQTATRGFSVTHIPKDYETMGLDALGLAPSLWSSTGASYAGVSYSSRWTQASFFGRLNYDYKGIYLLTATLRNDGSSKFAPDNKWGLFPSIAAAWRFRDEAFFSGFKGLSEGKLRLSYGETGNNRVGDFDYLPVLAFSTSSGYTFNNRAGASGASISSIGNSNLKWETTAQTNVGIDLGFLNQRILFTTDWYKKTTRDLLLRASVPGTLGVSTAVVNIGKMQNSGLEFSLTTVNIDQRNFKWTSAFNISFNRNKMLELTKNATYLTNAGANLGRNNSYNFLPAYISKLGSPLGQLYGVIFDGIYQYEDFNVMPNGTYLLKTGVPYYNTQSTPQPGWAKYKDINGDGIVNGSDYTVIGRGQPIHTGGLNNSVNYKNFDLSVFFQWRYGNDLLNANRIVFEAPAENSPQGINLMATMANSWSPTNQNSKIPISVGANYIAYNSRVVEDGSYLRLKTIQLGYKIDKQSLKHIGINALRFYVTAQNLYTWTKYSGPDPEVSTLYSVLTPGYDYMAYPIPKTIVFGLNATF